MPSDKEQLKARKNALLTELESIKDLLNRNDVDTIPLLRDAIIEQRADLSPEANAQEKFIDTTINEPETLWEEDEPRDPFDASFFDALIDSDTTFTHTASASDTIHHGVLPSQQSLFSTTQRVRLSTNPTPSTAQAGGAAQPKTGSHASLSKNPFLPPHVRQRFEKSLEESKPEPSKDELLKHAAKKAEVNASYTERLVDQLVAHHLPKIEAELRSKLLAIVKQHNERLKK
jgi:hypothetical protein